jgi:PAS domain S-box-containing protein
MSIQKWSMFIFIQLLVVIPAGIFLFNSNLLQMSLILLVMLPIQFIFINYSKKLQRYSSIPVPPEFLPDLTLRVNRKGVVNFMRISEQGSVNKNTRKYPGKALEEILPVDEAGKVREATGRVFSSGKLEKYQFRINLEGKFKTFEARQALSGPEETTIQAFESSGVSLVENETRLFNTLNRFPLPVMLSTDNGQVIMLNKAWSNHCSYSPPEIAWFQNYSEKTGNPDHTNEICPLEEVEIISRDGEKKLWKLLFLPLGYRFYGQELFMTLAIDITSQNFLEVAQKLLLERQERDAAFLIEIMRQLPFGILIAEAPSGRVILENTRFKDLQKTTVASGKTCAGYGLTWLDGRPVPPEELPLTRALQFGETTTEQEFAFIRADGLKEVVRVNAAPVRDESGRVIAGVSSFFEITERKNIEAEPGFSETSYRQVVNSTKEIIFQMDKNLRWVFLNPAWTEITGFQIEESLGQEAGRAFIPEDKERLKTYYNQLVERRVEYTRFQTRLFTMENDFRWVEVVARRTLDPQGIMTGIGGTIRDITEQRQSDEALKYRLKLEELIARISTGFINAVDGEIDLRLNQAVEAIGRFVEADRSYLGFYSTDGELVTVAFEWCAPGIEPHKHQMQNILIDPKSWTTSHLKKQKSVFLPNLAALPVEARSERQALEFSSVKSFIQVPLIYKYQTIGFLGFESIRTAKNWNEENLSLLKTFSSIFSSAIQQKESEKALVGQRDFAQLVVNTMGQGLTVTDVEGRFQFSNPAFARISGYSQQELFGKTLPDLVPEELKPQLDRVFEKLARGAEQTREAQLIRPNGERCFISLTAVPLYQEKRYCGATVVVTDLTERKIFEHGIITALEKERELSVLKTNFITTASHEFRTPLTTILSSSELLEHYGDRLPSGHNGELFRRIRDSVAHMNEMLNEVLLVNQAEAGRLEYNPQPLDLPGYLRELVEELQTGIGKEHRLVLETNPAVLKIDTDVRLVRQIVNNLVTNAVKYSGKGSLIHIILEKKAEEIVLKVQDEGIGIPAEALEHIFERFYRAENVGNIPGTGLGLPIIKQCLQLLQGNIKIESEIDKGSLFIVTFPFAVSSNSILSQNGLRLK